MNRWINQAAVAAVLVLATTAAMAQGGRQGGGMMGRGGLLQMDTVKKELKITADQGKKLAALNTGGPGGGQGGGQRDPEARAKAAAERDAKVKGILNATQYKRYTELRLQRTGPSALADPATAAKVGVTKAQQDKIRDLQTKAMEGMRGQFQGGGGQPDMDKMRTAFEKMRKETEAKILATLNATQKAKWTALLGKPFKFAA